MGALKKLGRFIVVVIVALATVTGSGIAVRGDPAAWLPDLHPISPTTPPITTTTTTSTAHLTVPATTLPATPAATPPPTPAATPAPTSQDTHVPNISAADCRWAISEMSYDLALDQAALSAARLYAGGASAAYAAYVDHWSQVLATLRAACASPPVYPDTMTCIWQVGWLDAASIVHDADAAAYPANLAWDRRWSASYTRLIVLYHGICP
jgi:hypothetical protein